jgi:cyclohexanecarboxyl-CoA dehydrogenase
MLDFTFTEEQEMFRNMVSEFVKKEAEPWARKRSEKGAVPDELTKRMAEMGLLGMSIPEKYGGSPVDRVTYGIATEEIGKVEGLSGRMFMNWAKGSQISQLGTEEIKQEWLPAMARGEKLICQGATESEAGSDIANLKTTARKDGKYYILNGEKNCVSAASQAQAMATLAKWNPNDRRPIIAFLVPLDTPGITISPVRDLMISSSERCIVSLEDVRIPQKYLLGDEEGKAYLQTLKSFDFNRAAAALGSFGSAQMSLDETCEYVKQRVTFNKPIATYQGVSFLLAEMATYIELGRWLAYKVLWMSDHGMRTSKESAMLHWWVGEKAHWIHEQCMLLHGHYGLSDDLPFERRVNASYVGLMGEAPVQIMKAMIARQLLGKEYSSV